MALIEQIRGLDSTLGSTKTVVGALTTKTVSGQGELIQGWNGSSYVYYDGAPNFIDGDWSVAGDLENIEGAGNVNTLFAQGGSTGDGGGGRLTYLFGTWRFTAGGVADYDFADVTTPSSGQARWMLTHNSATNKLVFYINGLKAIAADDITIGTILTPSSPFVIIGAAWNGSGYGDITGSDSRNVNGNLDVYDTCFDAAAVLNEYNTYLATTTLFDLNAASFSWSAKAEQNKQTAITNTPPTLKWSAKAVQNRATVSLATPPTFKWSAKAIQNRLNATHNSAIFSWSAKAITFALGIPLVVMNLVNATFSWSAKTVQNSLRATHNSAVFSWSAKAIQNLRTIALSAPSLMWSAKAIQNRLTATQTAAQIRLTALANSARLSLSLVNATMASWSAKAIQMKQTVTLNNAVFNWSSKVVEIITDAVVDLARRGRSRYSLYRQLLKQRRY